MVESIQSIGLRGVQSGLADTAKFSDELSSSFTPEGGGDAVTGDLVSSLVGLKQAEFQVYSSYKVIGVGNQLDRHTLDIFA